MLIISKCMELKTHSSQLFLSQLKSVPIVVQQEVIKKELVRSVGVGTGGC